MKPIRDLRAYGGALIDAASPTEGGRLAARVLTEPIRAPWARRVVVVLSSVAVFAGANVGLAFAANPSVPGDPLYGVDRAYERVATAFGIHQNLAAERFQEAAELSQRGELAAAFETASQAMEHLGTQSHAAEVLTQLAEDVKGIDSEDLPPAVQRTLNDEAKELFGIGQQVSEAAKGELDTSRFDKRSDQVLAVIREAMAKRGQTLPPGLDNDTPPGQSGDTPGQSGDAPGQSGDTPGQSGDTPGQSGDAPGQIEQPNP
jgi:hypothetical protein